MSDAPSRVSPLWRTLLVLLVAAGCDTASNPIAPAGTVLTVTASPTTIELDQTSTVTISGLKPDGNPLASGTQLSVTTTLGTLSSSQPVVGAGGRAVVTLTPDGRTGTATITVRLTSQTASAAVAVEIVPDPDTNVAPEVTIEQPADGTTVTEGTIVLLSAAAADPEDGDLSSQVVWSSSIDGELGTSTVISTTLSVGVHTITARVTDSGGVSDQATITVTVTEGATLAVAPMRLDLMHQRNGSGCPDPLSPIMLTSNGPGTLRYRTTGTLPAWLTAAPASGTVPATVQTEFTCDVEAGDLDLQHDLTFQGVDPATGMDVGPPVVVDVNVQVR